MAMTNYAYVLVESNRQKSIQNRRWLKHNSELIQESYDTITFESINFENFYKRNKIIIDEAHNQILEHYGFSNSDIEYLRENWMKDLAIDIGIGAGSMIPGIGSAVATGGVFYYLNRALNANQKGETFTAFMEVFSAIMTSASVVPAVGTALTAIGKGLMAPVKGFLGLFKGGGKIATAFAKIFSWFGKGAPAAEKAAAEEAATIVSSAAKEASAIGKGLDKLKGPLESLAKTLKDTNSVWYKIADKIPGGKKTLELLAKGVESIGSIGSLITKLGKAEGDEALAAVAGSIDEVAEVGSAIGNAELKAQAAALKGEKAALQKELTATAKKARSASKAAKTSKEAVLAADAADAAADAARLELRSGFKEVERAMKAGEYVDPKLVNQISDATLAKADDIAREAAEVLPDAFKNMSADDIANAFFKDGKQISSFKSQLKKAGMLSDDLAKLTGDEFAREFAKQFKNGPVEIAQIVKSASGSVSVHVRGANGAILKATPMNIFNMFGPEEGFKACMKIFEGGIESATAEALRIATKEMTEAAAEAAAKRGVATNVAKKIKLINSQLDDIISRIVTETMEEVAESGARELGEEVAEEAVKNTPGLLKAMLKGVQKRAYDRLAVYLTQALEMDDIEKRQATYGTRDDARMTSDEKSDAQGLIEYFEMRQLNSLIRESRRRSRIIKGQKLSRLIH